MCSKKKKKKPWLPFQHSHTILPLLYEAVLLLGWAVYSSYQRLATPGDMRWRVVSGLTHGRVCMVGSGYGIESFIARRCGDIVFFFPLEKCYACDYLWTVHYQHVRGPFYLVLSLDVICFVMLVNYSIYYLGHYQPGGKLKLFSLYFNGPSWGKNLTQFLKSIPSSRNTGTYKSMPFSSLEKNTKLESITN
jgi:hypothetical protein